MRLTHIDLFAGIGGFSLALDTIFYDHKIEHIFCDNNPFSQAVLKKHWPKAEIYGDIRTLTNTRSEEQRWVSDSEREEIPEAGRGSGFASNSNDKRLEGEATGSEARIWGRHQRCFIVTGGFPCQPFSAAGRRKGTADDRYLWPEMFRVITEFQPEWVVAENVRGLVTWNDGMVLEQVCADLESQGYEVQPLIIPAVAVNAPHRRDRVWFVAHRTDKLGERSEQERSGSRKPEATIGNGNSDVADTNLMRPQKQGAEQQTGRNRPNYQANWQRDWLEVATKLCGMDARVSTGVDRLKLSASKHRNERLKSLGNAVVPQVVMQILKAIRYAEKM